VDDSEATRFDERDSLVARNRTSAVREQAPDSVAPTSHVDRLRPDRVAALAVDRDLRSAAGMPIT
jgi:hypothetical protein